MAGDYVLGLGDANSVLLVYAASSPPSKSLSKGSSAYKSPVYTPVQHYWQKYTGRTMYSYGKYFLLGRK